MSQLETTINLCQINFSSINDKKTSEDNTNNNVLTAKNDIDDATCVIQKQVISIPSKKFDWNLLVQMNEDIMINKSN